MKLTRSVSYALGVLLRVHTRGSERLETAARISKGCDLPPRFLYRILRKLVDRGLLQATSGPKGGYRLARKAEAITLLDVVQAIDGPVKAVKLTPIHSAQRGAIKQVNRLCEENAKSFAASLKEVTLASLQPAVPTRRKTGPSTNGDAELDAPPDDDSDE